MNATCFVPNQVHTLLKHSICLHLQWIKELDINMFCVILFHFMPIMLLLLLKRERKISNTWSQVKSMWVYQVVRVWLISQIKNAPVCKISGGPWNIVPTPWPAKLWHTVNPSFLAMNLQTNKVQNTNHGILILHYYMARKSWGKSKHLRWLPIVLQSQAHSGRKLA